MSQSRVMDRGPNARVESDFHSGEQVFEELLVKFYVSKGKVVIR